MGKLTATHEGPRPSILASMSEGQPELEGISGILVVDATADGRPITYASPGFELLTGYGADEVVGRSPKLLQGPDTDPRAVAALSAAITAGEPAYATLLNYRADGTPFWNELTLAPERDGSGAVVRWLGVQRDVTDRMRRHARLQELAYFDPLTGLANQAALHDELRSALHRARVHDREAALLLVDLDDFRHVNDRHGRRAGDVLLRAVADRLRAVVRPQDLLARHDSDTFALLLKDLPGNAAAVATDLADRVLAALAEPFGADALQVRLGASIGVALFPSEAATAAEMVDGADIAVETAKAEGKNRVHVHRRRHGDDLLLAPDAAFAPGAYGDELAAILARGDLTVAFQPIVDLATGGVVAVEALARGPEGSPLHRPDRLFAAAEAAGRVVELDWACRAVTVRAALDRGLGSEVAVVLNCAAAAAGTPPPAAQAELWARAERELHLLLEVDERALAQHPAALVNALAAERRAGHAVGLDDLGAGVRGLAAVGLAAPAVLKVDLRLMAQRPAAERAAIAAAVATEAARTGATVAAEGIEAEDQLATARALGATIGQGWLFGRPGDLPTRGTTVPGTTVPGTTVPVTTVPVTTAEQRTPFEVASATASASEATGAVVAEAAGLIEQQALEIGEGAIVLAAVRDAEQLTPSVCERYRALARSASFVATFGVAIGPTPAPGVRGCDLDSDDPLASEWCVLVVGPETAAALVARDLGGNAPQAERRYELATTRDRDVVLAAARTLVRRLTDRVPTGTTRP